jgi:hypothetical protein
MKGRKNSEDVGVDRRIVLEWILGNWLDKGSVVDPCEHDNEPSHSIKDGEFPD